jgi:hypothetical protein
MSLAGKLLVSPRDLIKVQPVSNQPIDPDDEWQGYAFLPSGPLLTVYSEKAGAGEGAGDNRTETSVSYTLYADYRRGASIPVTEKHQIWHPEFSLKLENGNPDYTDRLLDIQSVRVIRPDMVLEIQASGSY